MNQIDRLKALRDEARARIDAAKKALEEGSDGRMVASLDELISELETHPNESTPSTVVPLVKTAAAITSPVSASALEQADEFHTPAVEEVLLEAESELEIEEPAPVVAEEPAPVVARHKTCFLN